jgi:hypothetical protein
LRVGATQVRPGEAGLWLLQQERGGLGGVFFRTTEGKCDEQP